MNYQDLYRSFKDKTNYSDERIQTEHKLVIRNFSFRSRTRFPLPAGFDDVEGSIVAAYPNSQAEKDEALILINQSDQEIEENLDFRYHMIMPSNMGRARNVIMMFHGLNEKYWTKYLPWAAYLAQKTDRAVLLFPIAFHMNRAPALWNDAHAMHRLSKQRRQTYPDTVHSSFSNVAISTRLHARPERFVWSGLESYHDVIDLVETIKADKHPAVFPDAGIDFCSYSIGTFLGQILLMTNKNGYFSRSRYATFCGGPVFNRLSPVSKFILDSEAGVSLYSYLVEHLESHMKNNKELNQLLSGDYDEGVTFRSLLEYRKSMPYREDKFRWLSKRFYAIALADDAVVPPYEVINTFKGSKRDIDIRVDVLDFPYPYRHEDPFPVNQGKIAHEVDKQFRRTFDLISGFLQEPVAG